VTHHKPFVSFTDERPTRTDQVRYAETQSLQITQGYVSQAQFVIGCDAQSNSSSEGARLNAPVEFQFSTNHGRTWERVLEVRSASVYCYEMLL